MNQRTLWQFASTIYSNAAVANACLWLQDHCAVDVNMLLFALWLAADGRRDLDLQAIAAIDGQIKSWRQEIIVPLRNVRRRMKLGPSPAPSEATEKLRSKLQTIEIEAEKIELAVLETWLFAQDERSDSASSSGDSRLQQNVLNVVNYFCPASTENDADAGAEIKPAITTVVTAVQRMVQ